MFHQLQAASHIGLDVILDSSFTDAELCADFEKKEGKDMLLNDERRVLSRRNAYELTFSECEQVQGAFIIHTAVCTIHVNPNGTCTFEGDCEPVPRCQQG